MATFKLHIECEGAARRNEAALADKLGPGTDGYTC